MLPGATAAASGQLKPTVITVGAAPRRKLPEPLGTSAEQDVGAVPLADFDQGVDAAGLTPTAWRWSRRWKMVQPGPGLTGS